jgi:hypothetical protein
LGDDPSRYPKERYGIKWRRGQEEILKIEGVYSVLPTPFDDSGADYAAGRILPLWEAPPPRWRRKQNGCSGV